jgi:hypothetical protein
MRLIPLVSSRWLLEALAVVLVTSGTAACQPSSEPPPAPFRLAVLGDSISTGAATHPALAMDAKRLWGVFTGSAEARPVDAELGELPPPGRLWPSVREFFGGADWVHRNTMQLVARRFLDTEEYSWGYAVARALLPGTLAERAGGLAIAAENGAKTEAMPFQLERVLEASGGRLPEKLFVFYTGNDLCGMAMSQVTSEADYRRALRAGLAAVTRAPAAPGGSDVYVMAYLSVLQLLHGESILAKEVEANGEKTTCREMRERGFQPKDPAYDPGLPEEARWFGLVMPPNPAGYCATLFGPPSRGGDELVGALANRIRAYRGIQQEVVADLSGKQAPHAGEAPAAPPLPPSSAVRFHYVAETAELSFAADDIAGDCFHLARPGQEKVAQAVLSYLNRVDTQR